MKIKVCVGSSCHLKGSYDVIEEMKRLLDKYGIADKVELGASFCLGNCINGVTLLSEERILHNVNKENAEEVLKKEVLPFLEADNA